MALKILLADDSVPAQNMGKKILTDAGYEVLAVSNGLEALKKIADSVPDIAILDIFMPGYTGLEVCSRLRGNAVTADLPVILTVGKLEPYRPEDGEKVKSSAVIVKPFASGELLSAVRSLVGLPFAVSRDVPEAKAPAPPQPSSTPVPEDEDQEEAPMLAGFGFDGVPSAPAASLKTLGWDPGAKRTPFSATAVEEAPAIDKPAINPEFEAAPQADVAAPSPTLTAFDLEPEVASPHQTEATALVEWWQPAPEPGDAVETEIGTSLAPPVSDSESAAVAPRGADAHPSQEIDVNQQSAVAAPAAPAVSSMNAEIVKAGEPAKPELSPSQQTSCGLAGDPASPQQANCGLAGDPAVDRESRMHAFEALFNSDEAIPVEEKTAALPDLLAQEELEAAREDEGEAVPPIALEDGPAGDLSVAPAATTMQELEIAPADAAGELQLDAESIAHWLSNGEHPQELPVGTLPHALEPPITAALVPSPDQPAPACDSFCAGIPDPAEGLTGTPRAEVEAAPPMVCYLPKEPAAYPHSAKSGQIGGPAESTRESSVYASLEPAATEFGYAETVSPQVEVNPVAQQGPEAMQAREVETEVRQSISPAANESSAETVVGENGGGDAKRIHQAVESVFDRFRPLLIAAIARELTKSN